MEDKKRGTRGIGGAGGVGGAEGVGGAGQGLGEEYKKLSILLTTHDKVILYSPI